MLDFKKFSGKVGEVKKDYELILILLFQRMKK